MTQRSDQPKSYYEILGVPSDAGREEIESAYRSLARKYHPDARPEIAGAVFFFKQATEAYEVLGDPERRRQYDRQCLEKTRTKQTLATGRASEVPEAVYPVHPMGSAPADLPSWQSFGSLVDEWFSGLFRSLPPQCSFAAPEMPQRQPAGRIWGKMAASLGLCEIPAFFDPSTGRVPVVSQPQSLPYAGMRSPRDIDAELMLMPEEARLGGPCEFTVSFSDACPNCDARTPATCQTCRGTGTVNYRSRIKVRIPPGVADRDVFRLPGHGKPARHTEPAGDLYLRVHVRPCW
jgi:molecular chaperone DnaJ